MAIGYCWCYIACVASKRGKQQKSIELRLSIEKKWTTEKTTTVTEKMAYTQFASHSRTKKKECISRNSNNNNSQIERNSIVWIELRTNNILFQIIFIFVWLLSNRIEATDFELMEFVCAFDVVPCYMCIEL